MKRRRRYRLIGRVSFDDGRPEAYCWEARDSGRVTVDGYWLVWIAVADFWKVP